MRTGPEPRYLALAAILLVAFGLRLHNLGFGLPSLYDPDEPLFVIKAAELLGEGTLNPRWFGHPGTITIYLTALTSLAVFLWGFVSGSWSGVSDFTAAAFADPGLLFLPARLVMVLLGVISVWLTYSVGRILHGTRVGLAAAALLAINSLHVVWSQVIRTDINASVFMLGALYFSVRVVKHGALRDYALAGILTGVAVATKWPAASIFISIIGASIARTRVSNDRWFTEAHKLALAAAAALAALIVSSPFLLLDWQTVLQDLSGEARPIHLGHTGEGFLGNLIAYSRFQIAGTMGWVALILIGGGVVISSKNSAESRWTLLPAAALFLAVICSQQLIWSRWILPLMPMLSIFAAVSIVWLADRIATRARTRAILILAPLLVLCALPSLINTHAAIRERENDTRIMASNWAMNHIPADSTVVLEHLELSLRDQPWKILFPVGRGGCIDGVRALQAGVRYEDLNRERNGAPIVNLGYVARHRLDSCSADFAILTYFDLYQAEALEFPEQYAAYRRLLANGRTVAIFRPKPGLAGGPVVRIVALPPQ